MTSPIDAIFDLFHHHGSERYGEDVTQLDHALQAADLAQHNNDPDTLIAAALLHDIGQFMGGAGHAAEAEKRDARHEEQGAAYLAELFPPAVTAPIRLHVAAKRYLCGLEPIYLNGLSAASALSLHYQGGPMDEQERAAFEREPFWREAIQLRIYDDAGKAADREIAPLENYRSLLQRVLINRDIVAD